MNKIFKVIYSKAKHCYVVASELAKSYTKGGGSRSIRRAMAALCIAASIYATSGSALAVNQGGHLDGSDYIGDTPYHVTIDSDVSGSVYGHKGNTENIEEASVTMTGGTVNNVCGGITNSGNVASNSVTISGNSTINCDVYGGHSSGAATSNSVTISGNSTINCAVFGGHSSGAATSNSVIIRSGTISNGGGPENNPFKDVYGGFSYSGNAASNSVNISGGIVNNYVYGGYVDEGSGSAASNSVNISGGTVNHDVYGGYVKYHFISGSGTGAGASVSNIVNISGGNIKQNLYGGCSYTRDADSNYVNISGGTIGYVENSINYGGTVYGGWSKSGDSASNSVNISGDTTNILGNIYGGVASSTGYANYNQVNISTGTLNIVYGGWSKEGSTASNSVTISGDSTKINEVYGGYVDSGTGSANYNKVNSDDTEITAGGVFGGKSIDGEAYSNSVNICGGNIGDSQDNHFIIGGYSDSGLAASNSVNISGGRIEGVVCGGYSGSGLAASNSVNISGGNFVAVEVSGGASMSGLAASNSVNISGGEVYLVQGGLSLESDAKSNSVNISGGLIITEVYGGYTNSLDVFGNSSFASNAASNSVTISGGTVNNSVYGGYVQYGNGSSKYNQVNISGGTIYNNVFGGFSYSGLAANNSINTSGGTVGNAYGGFSICGLAASNSVNISGDTTQINDSIYGGYVESGTGSAYENKVNISSGTINKNVFGGFSQSGNTSSNSINISGDTTIILGNIYGGVASSTGYADYNRVNISTGTLKIVYGGYSKAGNTSSNSVRVSGDSTKINEVYGGYVDSGTGSANYNQVNISSGTIKNVAGGWSYESDAVSNSVTISGGTVNNSVYGGYSDSGSVASNSVTISENNNQNPTLISGKVYGGYIYDETGYAKENKVTISGGTVIGGIIGGQSYEGNSASNSVNISGETVIGEVISGRSSSGLAVSNIVNISSGTVNKYIMGGFSGDGSAASNSVNIIGGKIYTVYGGYAGSSGNANENQVTMTGGQILYSNSIFSSGELYGGYSYTGSAASNSVTIGGNDTKIGDSVYGGYVDDGTGYASYNQVNISSGTVGLYVYGGCSYGGDAVSNSVNIRDVSVNESVYGGRVNSGTGSASYNLVNISGGTINGYVSGGYANGSGDANENQVTMTGGEILYDDSTDNSGNLYGGYSASGSAASNSVNISGETIIGKIYGGHVNSGNGSASYNIVNISGGKVDWGVYGGYSSSGDTASNSVNISGGTVNRVVYGGYSSSGDTASNSVNISGGIIEDVYGGSSTYSSAASNSVNISGGIVAESVFGGFSGTGSAASNNVNISGGTVNREVYGGFSSTGSATSNSVNISGGTFGSNSKIYSGFVVNSNNSTISDNKVNLSGPVKGLDNTEIYGYYYDNSGSGSHSGNELHIGRTVDYDENGKIKCDANGNIIYKADETTIWQGKSSDGSINNKVKNVTNFETIALHSVEWSNSIPVLAAESFTYDSSTSIGGNVTLDISTLTLYNSNATGTVTLLQSNTDNNFSKLKLKYSDSEAGEIPSAGQIVKTVTDQTMNVKGIKLTYDSKHSVKLEDTYKKVNYTAFYSYKKAELSGMKWSDGGYTFSGNEAIDQGELVVSFANDFKVEGAEDQNEADSLDLLDLSKIMGTGKIKNAVALEKTLTYDRTPSSASGLTLSLKQIDEIKTNEERTKLTYKIGTKNVTKATFDAEVAWNTTQPYYDAANSSYTFSSNTAFDAKNLTLTLTDNQKDLLKTDDSMTLLTTSGITDSNSVVQPDNNTFKLSRTGDMGTNFDGTATGEVLADTSALKYKIARIETDKINLGSRSWSDNTESLPDTWTLKADTVIDAGDFAFTGKTDTVLASGDTKTLLEGSGFVSGSNIAEKTLGIEYTENSVKLGATAYGQIETITDAVQYKVNSVIIDSLDISGWNGTNDAAAVPNSWVSNANGVNVTATNFDPTVTTGSKSIITASAGMFKDENIEESIRFAENSSFDNDSEKGVTLSGKKSGGVKTTDEGKALTYYTIHKDVADINLGIMNWGEGRSMDLTANVSFKNASKIDAEELKFALSNEQTETLAKGSSMQLLSNAAGLTAGVKVTYNENATYHSQAIDYNTANGVLMLGTLSGTVTSSDEAVNYIVKGIALDEINIANWDDTKEASAVLDGWTSSADGVKVTAETFAPTVTTGEKTILTASSDIFKNEKIDENIKYKSSSFKDDLENGITLSGNQTGGVKASDDGKLLTYYATDKTIDKFELANWDGENATTVNSSWKVANGATVETDEMSNLPDSDSEKEVLILKSDKDNFFANVSINGENAYGKKQNKFSESDEAQIVIVAGTQDKGVTFDDAKTNILYKVGSKDVTSFKLNTVAWKDGAELLSRDKYNYSKLTELDTNDFNISYEKPETLAVNQSMTLLKANDTLKDIAAIDNSLSYQYAPVSGVTMDAVIKSSLEAKSGKVTLTTVSNKADKLTFGSVDWMDKGALIDHKTLLNNVSFDGAAVDTTKIAFVNKEKLSANMKMTLVSDFDGSPGSITGSKYKVGTAYEGQGSAYMDGSDLVFKTKTSAGVSDETHTTVMAMEAGVAMLAAGNEHVGNTIEGLELAANRGSDGVSTFASVGGSSGRYETGSHVDTNNWNCTLAVGKNLEKKDGTMEYGLFAEYGRGNYTLHMNGIEDAGSGSNHYTGGGLLLKWTNSHNVYTEASFRMGNMKDNASSLLHDGVGNAYGYNIKAKYRGGHFGIGKTYKEDENTKLDIYGKFFYNQREGINFAAGTDQYSLDDVRSRLLRAGFRLSSIARKWNRYGGISYDYEFGGQSNGTVNGNEIRSASIKGGTLRGEFGYCREATKDNPWKTDISLYGFTGKRNGVGGSVAFEYHF